MGKPSKNWARNPATISDISAVLAASISIILSVLDILNLVEVRWFKDNVSFITVFLVALLVVLSVLDRRIAFSNSVQKIR